MELWLTLINLMVLVLTFASAEDDGQYRPWRNRVESNKLLRIPRTIQPPYYEPAYNYYQPQYGAPFYTPAAPRPTVYRSSNERNARVLRLDNNNDGKNYHYRYETENGIKAEEAGTAGVPGTRNSGFYEYIGDDGVQYRVDYIADENGFRAYGAHLPTPPPIPEAIARSLRSRGLLA